MTAPEKFRKVMHEFKNKNLHHGTTGEVVTDRDMALAIAFSEAKKIQPNYGQYECGGDIMASGGELMKKYRAEDYFPMGDKVEFMFDTKRGAEKMSGDYDVSPIVDGDNYYVAVDRTMMEDGGSTERGDTEFKGSKNLEKFNGVELIEMLYDEEDLTKIEEIRKELKWRYEDWFVAKLKRDFIKQKDVDSSYAKGGSTEGGDIRSSDYLGEKNTKLYNELVPSIGKAHTVGGEMVRAINVMHYRWLNSGDRFFHYLEDYGSEVSASNADSIAYLYLTTCPQIPSEVRAELKKELDEGIGTWGSTYQIALNKALKIVIDYVESDSRSEKTNYHDYLNYRQVIYKNGGSTQGYNDKLDESLGNRKGIEARHQQSSKDRRDESKAMEDSLGRRAYESVGTMDKMAKGGEVRSMELGDAVAYKDKTHFITQKDGVVGIADMSQGAWGSDYPFIPLSKLNLEEVTDMYGKKVSIKSSYAKGGSTSNKYKKSKQELEDILKNAKKCRTLKDLKNSPLVSDIELEIDGSEKSWWGWTASGFQVDGNHQHTIHEDTIKDVCEVVNEQISVWEDDEENMFADGGSLVKKLTWKDATVLDVNVGSGGTNIYGFEDNEYLVAPPIVGDDGFDISKRSKDGKDYNESLRKSDNSPIRRDEVMEIINQDIMKFADGGEIGSKIKDWYTKNHPTDDLGEEMNDTATFEDLWNGLNEGVDVYDVMGVGDSLVRERLFEHLAKVKGVEYNYIYNKWLYPSATDNEIKSSYAKGGSTDKNWMQGAVKEMKKEGTEGLFTRKAKRRGMTTVEFANEVLGNPSKFSEKTRKEAQFMKNANPELFGFGGFVAGAVLGAGTTAYLQNRKKVNKFFKDETKNTPKKSVAKKVEEPKEKEYKDMTWKEKVRTHIEKEGVEYGFEGYSDYKDLTKDKRFHTLRKNYLSALKSLDKYVETTLKDDFVAGFIEEEGADYALVRKRVAEWDEVSNDKKFQALVKKYMSTRSALLKYIGLNDKKYYAKGGSTDKKGVSWNSIKKGMAIYEEGDINRRNYHLYEEVIDISPNDITISDEYVIEKTLAKERFLNNKKNYVVLPTAIEEEYANGGSTKKKSTKTPSKGMVTRIKVTECMKDGKISCKDLEMICGHKPEYPIQTVGSMTFEKCFLSPYYRKVKK